MDFFSLKNLKRHQNFGRFDIRGSHSSVPVPGGSLLHHGEKEKKDWAGLGVFLYMDGDDNMMVG